MQPRPPHKQQEHDTQSYAAALDETRNPYPPPGPTPAGNAAVGGWRQSGMRALQPRRTTTGTAPSAPAVAAAAASTPTKLPAARAAADAAVPHHPVDLAVHAVGLPGTYRATASQFLRAVARLNRVTAAACGEDVTTFLHMADAGQWASAGAAPASTDVPPSAASPAARAGMHKMARVPLLPVTVCTDGATVLLVDCNGTARHGNYVAAAQALARRLPAPPVGLPPLSPPMLLWWTLKELQPAPPRVPLSTARAALLVKPGAQGAALAELQPSRLTLRYGEALVLVFAAAREGEAGEAGYETPTSSGVLPPHQVGPHAQRQQRHAASYDVGYEAILRDLYHGYLPCFMEAAYPDGGVQLRACWCEVASRAAPPQPPAPRPQGEVHRSDGVSDAADLHVVPVPAPLVAWAAPHTTSAATGSRGRDAAAVMESLRPTAMRGGAGAVPALASAVLQLPSAVRGFLAQETKGGTSAVKKAAAEQHPTPSVHPPPPATAGAAPFLRLSLRHASATAASAPRRVGTADSTAPGGEDGRGRLGSRDEPQVPASGGPGSSLVYVSTLFRAPQAPHPPTPSQSQPSSASRAAQSTAAHRHANSGQPTRRADACTSVVVLTAAGRVELVAPPEPATQGTHAHAVAAAAAVHPVTILDVKYSLLRSAVGRALRLRAEELQLVYAPGTPPLSDADVVDTRHAVLRLRRRPTSAPAYATRGAGKEKV